MPDFKMTWEYLAGFFDGEGCICIYKVRGVPNVIATVSQSEPRLAVIDEICRFLVEHEIRFSRYHRSRENKNWSDVNTINIIHRGSLRKFLKYMIPKLIVKKEKAIEALVVVEDRIEGQDVREKAYEENCKKALQSYLDGASFYKVQCDFGVSHKKMKQICRERDIHIRTRSEAARIHFARQAANVRWGKRNAGL